MATIRHIPKEKLDPKFMQDLHSTTFDFFKSGEDFRVDGGYIAEESDGTISGYVLYRELSNSVIDLAYGAADKSMRGFLSVKNLAHFTELMFDKYETIATMVWNKNYKMLKIYMSFGFDIVGIKHSRNGDLFVLIEKTKETLKGEDK